MNARMDIQKLPGRVAGILSDPRAEWRKIAEEQDGIGSFYTSYIMPLAAIPAVAMLVGLALAGNPVAGGFAMGAAIRSAIYSYAGAMLGAMIAALVIERLAPRFKSSGSTVDALKLVGYASTPVWVAGVFYVLLFLAPLVLAGVLYAVYLFYLGLPPMMKTHPDQVVPYMVVSAIAILVINMLLAAFGSLLGIPSFGI
jgi:hypothetical protein